MATLPTIAVEVAFDDPPLTASPTWTAVTADVLWGDGLSIRRGRSSELESASAGTLTFTVKNKDRKYDPNYASSPYAGKLLPRKQVRVTATWNAVTYNLWRGFVQAITQGYDVSNRWAVATFDCVDAFNLFATAEIGDNAWEVAVREELPGIWYRLDETMGTIAYDSGVSGFFDGSHSGVTLGADPIITGSDHSATYGAAGAITYGRGPIAEGEAFTLEGWFTITATGGTDNILYDTLDFDGFVAVTVKVLDSNGKLRASVQNAAGTTVNVDSSAAVTGGARHHFAVVWDRTGATVYLYIDGSSTSTALANFRNLISPSRWTTASIGRGMNGNEFQGNIDEVVLYGRVLSGSTITAHYNAGATAWTGDSTGTRLGRYLDALGWPSALRDIDTGNSTVQAFTTSSGNLLADAQDLEATEQGVLVMGPDGKVVYTERHARLNVTSSAFTFSDSGSVRYSGLEFDYGDTDLRNHAVISSQGQLTQETSDATSITAYGKRSYSRSTIDDTQGNLLSAAQWIVDRFKDPQTRVTAMTVKPGGNPSALWPAVLAIDVSTRLTVSRTPQAVGSAFSQDVFVEGVEHSVSSADWTARYFLTPADTRVYWILNTSALNTDARLAF